MKRALFLIGGLLWICFALGFAAFLVQYIAGGAGPQFFGGPVLSESVLLVHVVGFGTAIFLCFAIGVGLCARGMLSKNDGDERS